MLLLSSSCCVLLTAQSSWVRSLSQDCLKNEWKSSIWNYESVLQQTRPSSFDIRELTKNYFSWIHVPCTSFHFTMELLRCCQGSLPSRCVGHCRGCAPSWPWGGWSTSKGRLPTKQNSLKCAPRVLIASTGNNNKDFCPHSKAYNIS